MVLRLLRKNISLLQRSTLQDSISAHQIGGVVKMTAFIFKAALITEVAGALFMLPTFCGQYGFSGNCNTALPVDSHKRHRVPDLGRYCGEPAALPKLPDAEQGRPCYHRDIDRCSPAFPVFL